MKKPSRKMPQMQDYQNQSDIMLTILNTFFLGGFIYLLIEIPITLPTLVLLFVWGTVNERRYKARLHRIAAERQNNSICTFARSFNYRNVDTWAIRAVYKQLQKYLEDYYSCANFPINKEDSLNLFNLAEDINDDWYEIAKRIGRSTNLDNVEQNPFSGKVDTVEDLVFFLVNQPKIQNS